MCWRCDHPDATEADYLKLIQATIDSHGWFVQVVEKGRWRPGFAYTVGLSELGLPELLVTGLAYRKSLDLLNDVAHLYGFHGLALEPGRRQERRDGGELEIVEVAEPTVHLVRAQALYGDGIRALQLVYADDRGRWPWEVGFRGRQPVLGPQGPVSRVIQ